MLLHFFFQIIYCGHIAVFDCGSSGTRVLIVNYTGTDNVYKFQQFAPDWQSYVYSTDKTRKMLDDDSKKKIAESIYNNLIINGTNKFIPIEERPSVPLLFYHTAGLRGLSESTQNDINDYLYNYMKENTNYDVQRKNFKTLTGWEETLYQWLTVNKVMNQIDSDTTMPILHMGGESMQFGLELREYPENDFMKSFVYQLKINGKYHYVFLYSWMKYGTGSLADLSHVERVNQGNMESPCMYRGGYYSIEVHSKEHPEGGFYYDLNGTGDFDYCAALMKSVFSDTRNRDNCHGYPPTVSDYLVDNCIPFADKFTQVYGGSCVGDAMRYLHRENGSKVEEPLTFRELINLNREYAKSKTRSEVLVQNDLDSNAEWTMSNAAMVSEFMKKAFCSSENLGEDGLYNLKMYFNDTYKGQLQAWNLGAAIAYKSDGFEIIQPDEYKESWFTAGRIAGITIGCVAFVAIIVGLVVFFVIRKRKGYGKQINKSESENV